MHCLQMILSVIAETVTTMKVSNWLL